MQRNSKRKIIQSAAAAAAAAAGVGIYQKAVLWQAERKKEERWHETWHSPRCETAYTRHGSGRPIVLLHSMLPGANSSEWEKAAKELSREFAVYCVDLPGFGASEKSDQPWTAYQYALWLNSFLTEVVKRPACVAGVGHSADILLAASLFGPKLIRRAVLISPCGINGGFAPPQEVKELKLLLSPMVGTQLFLMGTGKGAVKKALQSAVFAKECLPETLTESFAASARVGAKGAQATYAAIETGFFAADTKRAYQALPCSALVIWGEENTQNPADVMQTMEQMRPQDTFLLFEETGALPHVEHTAEFLAHLKEYLNQKGAGKK